MKRATMRAVRAPGGDVADEETRLRCDLAAVCRVAARFDWGPHLGACISARVPSAVLLLVNPHGMLLREITASALVACDLDGGAARTGAAPPAAGAARHAQLLRARPDAGCIIEVEPRYLTALALIAGGRMALAHHNNLRLNDRIVYDEAAPADDGAPDVGGRIARLLDGRSILLQAHRGVTVVGASIPEAFGECATAEHTTRFQMTAMTAHRGVRELPQRGRLGYTGPWGKVSDARMLLDAWRRVLDEEEPDYAT